MQVRRGRSPPLSALQAALRKSPASGSALDTPSGPTRSCSRCPQRRRTRPLPDTSSHEFVPRSPCSSEYERGSRPGLDDVTSSSPGAQRVPAGLGAGPIGRRRLPAVRAKEERSACGRRCPPKTKQDSGHYWIERRGASSEKVAGRASASSPYDCPESGRLTSPPWQSSGSGGPMSAVWGDRQFVADARRWSLLSPGARNGTWCWKWWC